MKELYLAIKARLEAVLLDDDNNQIAKFIHIWNNQLSWMAQGKEYSFGFPAIFIEFVNPSEIQYVGNGVQVYDPLDINVHICHEYYDAADGTMEQNLEVFVLKQKVLAALQKFHCDGSGTFTREGEEQDYDHPNYYHFIQRYRTTWIDKSMEEPVDGYDIDPPLTTEITTVILPQIES
jgi:hypothetical protein